MSSKKNSGFFLSFQTSFGNVFSTFGLIAWFFFSNIQSEATPELWMYRGCIAVFQIKYLWVQVQKPSFLQSKYKSFSMLLECLVNNNTQWYCRHLPCIDLKISNFFILLLKLIHCKNSKVKSSHNIQKIYNMDCFKAALQW